MSRKNSFALVDTNVLLDVIERDPHWMEWSIDQLSRYPSRLIINPLVYTELCYRARAVGDVEKMILALGLKYEELPREALFLTAKAFKIYRKRGGAKTSPLADFFIGAHAAIADVPIITRDVSKYTTYFPATELISP